MEDYTRLEQSSMSSNSKCRESYSYTAHFAMTSTYPRPFFLLFTVPPLRAVGAPSRSSIELALLRDVVDGRGGGGCIAGPPAAGGGVPAVVDTERGGRPFGVGPCPGPGPKAGLVPSCDAPAPVDGRLSGVVPSCEIDGGRWSVGGPEDALPTLTDRLCGPGPLGGGGVARAEAVALFGSFLLTHFLSSGS